MAHLRHRSKHQQGLIAFDPNYRPSLWESAAVARDCIERMWEIADIALPSIDDEMTLFADTSEEAVIDRFAGRRWTACAIKRGERGPLSPALTAAEHPAFLQPPAWSTPRRRATASMAPIWLPCSRARGSRLPVRRTCHGQPGYRWPRRDSATPARLTAGLVVGLLTPSGNRISSPMSLEGLPLLSSTCG